MACKRNTIELYSSLQTRRTVCTMGTRRKSGKSGGGIRKKRGGAKRQRLASVVEAQHARDEKLARKIASMQRTGAGNAQIADISAEVEGGRFREGRGNAREARVERRLGYVRGAYRELMKGLGDELGSIAQGAGPALGSGSGEVVRKRPRNPNTEHEEDGENTVADATASAADANQEPALTASRAPSALEIDSAEQHVSAAIRENAHFDSSLSAEKVVVNPPESVGTFPGIGKVSVLLPAEKNSAFVAALKNSTLPTSVGELGLQPSMLSRWRSAGFSEQLSPLGGAFVAGVRNFQDVLLCRALPPIEEDTIRRLYVAHALSNALRARTRLQRHDAIIRKDPSQDGNFKDQSFNRARVLFLVPMRNVAYDVVRTIMSLAVGTDEGETGVAQVANSERFEEEFAPGPDDDDAMEEREENAGADGDDDGDDLESAQTSEGHMYPPGKSRKKPAEWSHVFRGNVDDDFKIGLSMTKKTIKLYSDFYDSDIIIASPLGLRRTLAAKASGRDGRKSRPDGNDDNEWKTGLGAETRKPREDNTDEGFLSSIEICVIDGAHVFSMQNWDTLCSAVRTLNRMPANTRETDFSRVRDWALDGLMAKFRQTVVLSHHKKAEVLSLVRGLGNHSGRIHIVEAAPTVGSMKNVVVSMRQRFFRVEDVETPADVPEKRFQYFCNNMIPLIRALVDSQTLIIVPSYFDFVRVRNKFISLQEDDLTFRFASMCEYSKASDVSRARTRFYNGNLSVVVMTERFHFFWRHWIRGANTIVWYGIPENAHFYSEILNMTAEAAESGRPVQAIALYDEYDAFALERIAGRSRCKRMIAATAKTQYLFV